MKLRLREHWRISTFRLAVLFGLIFIVGNVVLLGVIYWKINAYLERRIDESIKLMSGDFKLREPRRALAQVQDAVTNDLRKSNIYGLFGPDRRPKAGNLAEFPAELLPLDGKIHQFAHRELPQYVLGGVPPEGPTGLARAKAMPLINGDILVVGRDFTQQAKIKAITLNVVMVSGALIMVLGLAGGFALSLRPLRRIHAIRERSRRIVHGDLSLRMPLSGREDELDMLAAIVNLILEEIERLLTEVKSATDTQAHDLRTPLTRLRLLLYRSQQQLAPGDPHQAMLDKALTETDALLSRFRALLRIAEIENRQRKAGFAQVDPRTVIEQAAELFEALAEDKGLRWTVRCGPASPIEADPGLLFEVVSNLVDNAIKFTPPGGAVTLALAEQDGVVRIDVIDTGCGIAESERGAVLQRFYRSKQQPEGAAGFGLGLSIVAAIVHLHGFRMQFQDSSHGTHITVFCTS